MRGFKTLKELDFHDDVLHGVRVLPPARKSALALIEFDFLDDSTGAKKVLTFKDCSNLQVIMDFDVLADNWFAQTQSISFTEDLEHLRNFVQSHRAHWHVKYMAPSSKAKPIKKKLSSIKDYTLFRIQFFGGTVRVMAKNFLVKRSRRA